jgi:hypothetical protein
MEKDELTRNAEVMLRYWRDEEARRKPRKDLKRKRMAEE